MAILAYASSLFSTAFRLAVYIFLEVVPVRFAKLVLPTLYLLYLVASYAQAPPQGQTVELEEEIITIDEKTNEDQTVETDVTVAQMMFVRPSPALTAREALATIVFSLPSPSRGLRMANLLINSLLLLSAVEFVSYPFFDDASDVIYTRVGAVYPDAVKVVVRYPKFNSTDHVVRLAWRHAEPDPWIDGPILNLTAENDWVSTVRLGSLWPSTNYEYRLEDVNKTVLPYPAKPIQFHTFPDSRVQSGSHFRFVASSCVMPNFPYLPFQGRRIKGFDLLANYLWPNEVPVVSPRVPEEQNASVSTEPVISDSANMTELPSEAFTSIAANASTVVPSSPVSERKAPTEFMIFMGDFIYADVPIYFGDDKEAYRRLYRRNYQSDSFRKVYEQLPIFHTYDDHEIINNFVGQSNDSLAPFPNASDAFRLYNADANYDSSVEDQHYYDFRYGDVAFFVLDTRRYRSDISTEDPASHTMLGDKQLGALYDWLGKVNNTATFKFIVTSVPFTSLWQHDALTDSWAGFGYEKSALLSALQSVPNVILLSGDRHEFAAIEYTSSDAGHNVLEISTSPLSMFYVPFFRTLKMKSEGVVQKTRKVINVLENGTTEVTTVVDELPQEQVLKYIGNGNYKWSTIEVDTRDADHPVVKVEIMIDGVQAYSLTVRGKPVKLQSSIALGSFVPQTFKGVLDRIGLKPSRWF